MVALARRISVPELRTLEEDGPEEMAYELGLVYAIQMMER